jgi:hypothetical protein
VRRTIHKAALVLVAVVALCGCLDGSDLGPSASEDSDPTATEAGSASDVTRDEWQFTHQPPQPVTWEENGIRVEVTGVSINDATHPDLPTRVADFLDDDVQAVVVLELAVANDSGASISFNPDQGTLLLAREQTNADLWFSESIAGSEMLAATDDGGQVFWMLRDTSFEDAIAEEQLTYTARPAKTSDEGEEVAGEVTLVVRWDAPERAGPAAP